MIINSRPDNKFHIELLTQPYSSDAMVEFIEVQMTDVFTMIAAPAGLRYYRSGHPWRNPSSGELAMGRLVGSLLLDIQYAGRDFYQLNRMD